MSQTDPTSPTAALFTDLYELTMMQSYFDRDMHERAAFSLFVRELPENRNFLLAAGLDDVLAYLEKLRFDETDIVYLNSLGRFSPAFLDWLGTFRFTGDVHAVAEGTPVFANEPLVEIEAPIAQAQLVETAVMNIIQLQTMLATKAARVVEAAQGRSVVDFGARRMHGRDAAMKAARAFHIAGVNATSNVEAGRAYGIPVSGTMAHSYIEAFANEAEAFAAFVRSYPDTVLLVDTYDTLQGVQHVIELARRLGDDFAVQAVRLDSGDLLELSRKTRAMLDDAGLQSVGVFASGGLDEYRIAALLADGAPIDGFGVGTAMGVSDDAPSLEIAYKLTAYAGEGRMKLSTGKASYPGLKQVFRRETPDGQAAGDTIGLANEALEGRPLIERVMRGGERTRPAPSLEAIRERAARELARLPAHIRAVEPAKSAYPVAISDALESYTEEVRAYLGGPERRRTGADLKSRS
ncbi:MAG: nicotinate phosphoribosyltransferase [Dichotomicrobium sp.]